MHACLHPERWDSHVHLFDAQAAAVSGHYQPVDRTLQSIEAVAICENVSRLVLVQPSVYGADNSVLLEGLSAGHRLHRGVVVLDDTVDEQAMQAMHELGVRGVRFNLVSPVGNGPGALLTFKKLAPRLQLFGWHVQWYAEAADLHTIASLHEGSGVPAVLDHLAGMGAHIDEKHPAWMTLEKLAQMGSWVKLSGWYRLHADFPYRSLDAAVERIARLFPGRMVWGSDWPHTLFKPEVAPTYGAMLEPMSRVLSPAEKEDALTVAPARLYG